MCDIRFVLGLELERPRYAGVSWFVDEEICQLHRPVALPIFHVGINPYNTAGSVFGFLGCTIQQQDDLGGIWPPRYFFHGRGAWATLTFVCLLGTLSRVLKYGGSTAAKI